MSLNILYIGALTPSVELAVWKCKMDGIAVRNVLDKYEARNVLGKETVDLIVIGVEYRNVLDAKDLGEFVKSGIPVVALVSSMSSGFVEGLLDAGVEDLVMESELMYTDVAMRIKLAHHRWANKNATKSQKVAFAGLNLIKPYLSCSLFA